ncbi:hypothetical protein ACNQFN_02865 [Thauera butanivorans]|uniref:hypothetical protein n=1 Tax=Thauera butanivorans TaxID=86174 RepID=UPI003AB739C0
MLIDIKAIAGVMNRTHVPIVGSHETTLVKPEALDMPPRTNLENKIQNGMPARQLNMTLLLNVSSALMIFHDPAISGRYAINAVEVITIWRSSDEFMVVMA